MGLADVAPLAGLRGALRAMWRLLVTPPSVREIQEAGAERVADQTLTVPPAAREPPDLERLPEAQARLRRLQRRDQLQEARLRELEARLRLYTPERRPVGPDGDAGAEEGGEQKGAGEAT